MQAQIRLLLREQSDKGLHCLPYHLHLMGTLLPRNLQTVPFIAGLDEVQEELCITPALALASALAKC